MLNRIFGNKLFIIFFVYSISYINIFSIPFKIAKFTPLNLIKIRNNSIIGKYGVVNYNNAPVYNNLSNFKEICILKKGNKVLINKISDSYYFEKNQINKNALVNFYLIKISQNIEGWIEGKYILYPYIIESDKIYGIRELIDYYDLYQSNIHCLSFLFLDNSTNNTELEYNLFELQKGNASNLKFNLFDPEKIKIDDLNHDKIPEIILEGYYSSGLIDTDNFSTGLSEIWFNIKNNKIFKIFLKKIKEDYLGGLVHREYNYKYLDLDNDNFLETIEVESIEINEQDKILVNNQKEKVTKGYYTYKWNGNYYVLKENK